MHICAAIETGHQEIIHPSMYKVVLPRNVQYKTKEDVILLIQMDEYEYLERKPFLTFDYIKKTANEDKEFDVMRAIDSFLNIEGGVLIIRVDDNKKILGLDGDYSILPGERENFDKFQNHLRKLIRDKYFRNSIVGELIEIKRYSVEGNDICLIDIRKSPVPIFLFHPAKGQLFYVRHGDQSPKLMGMELSDYLKRHFCTSDVLHIQS